MPLTHIAKPRFQKLDRFGKARFWKARFGRSPFGSSSSSSSSLQVLHWEVTRPVSRLVASDGAARAAARAQPAAERRPSGAAAAAPNGDVLLLQQ